MLVSSLIGFSITVLLIHLLIKLAPRLGLVDNPDGHRQHALPTPLVGGLGMFCGLVISVLTLDVPLADTRSLFLGSVLLVIVGVLDDMHELSSNYRFVFQIAAAMIMVMLGRVALVDLGYLVDENLLVLNRWSVPLTVFAVVGLINAFNMSDGMDGQGGLVGLVMMAFICYMIWTNGGSKEYKVLLIFMFVLLGFLVFNLGAVFTGGAKTFMGDAGSMFIGFALAWFLVKLSQGDERMLRPVTAVWIAGLILMDAVSVMIRRAWVGKSPFNADRFHYHHLLKAAGLSHIQCLGIVVACTFLFGGIGVVGELLNVPEYLMFYGFLIVFTVYFLVTFHFSRRYAKKSPE